MTAIVQDLVAHALRMLRRHPWHSLGVASLLALGLGPVLALSALVDRLLLHNAPYPEPERVVMVHGLVPDYHRCQFNPTSFRALAEGTRGFETLAAVAPQDLALGRGADAVTLPAARVTADFFRVLRARPLMGRLAFTAEEDRWGGPRTVVLAERAWRRHFQGDPGLVGRTIVLDGLSRTVVGILPADLTPPSDRVRDAACFVPAAFSPEEQAEHGNNWEVFGRLAPGLGLVQVQASLDALAASGVVSGRTGFRAAPVGGELALAWRRPLALFGAAALLLLLLAGINSAHLILARSEARRGDLAVATALGAPAGRLAGQHLAEGLALGLAGLGLGLLVALAVRKVLGVHLGLTAVPPFRALTFAAGALATLFVVLFASAGPVWIAARTSPMGVLKTEGRGTAGGGRRWVLVGELALASVLLVGATLLLRTLYALSHLPTGLRAPGQVLTATVTLPAGSYPTPEARAQAFQTLEAHLAASPGVTHAALAQTGPFFKPNGSGTLDAPDGRPIRVNWHWLSGNLPGALGLELWEGRLPRAGERACVLSGNLARELWPAGGAVGRTVEDLTVVGVLSPSVERDPRQGFGRQIWLPLRADWAFVDLLLRGEGRPEALVPALRDAVRAAGPDLQLQTPVPLAEALRQVHEEPRKAARLLGALAGLALLLAAAGIYGVASQMSLQRRREFGLRLALGATPGGLARLVLRQGLRWTALGLGFGLLGSVWATLLLKGLLYGVGSLDPLTYLAGAAVLFAVALLALLIPALRAARIAPAEALRSE